MQTISQWILNYFSRKVPFLDLYGRQSVSWGNAGLMKENYAKPTQNSLHESQRKYNWVLNVHKPRVKLW